MNRLLQQLQSGVANDISPEIIILSLVVSFALGLIISFVYKATHRGFSYAGSFIFTLVMVTVIVAVIMMIIGSNIVLSLGLIGALSIIRFRTVVKDTKDMAYLFWVIAEGLAVGSGNYLTAAVSVVFIGVFVAGLTKINFGQVISASYVMVLHIDPGSGIDEKSIGELIRKNKIKWDIRSHLLDKESSIKEITYSLYSRARPGAFDNLLKELNEVEGIKRISLLTPETNLFI